MGVDTHKAVRARTRAVPMHRAIPELEVVEQRLDIRRRQPTSTLRPGKCDGNPLKVKVDVVLPERVVGIEDQVLAGIDEAKGQDS